MTHLLIHTKVRHLLTLATAIFALVALNACNTEDDMEEIFNNKTWKLSRLTTEGNKAQFYYGLWNSESEEKSSRELLSKENNFTLKFNVTEVSDRITGKIDVQGVNAHISNGDVFIGSGRSLSLSGKVSGTERDKLAIEFMRGMTNVYKYEGDANSLTLYYKDGQNIKIMGFTAQ